MSKTRYILSRIYRNRGATYEAWTGEGWSGINTPKLYRSKASAEEEARKLSKHSLSEVKVERAAPAASEPDAECSICGKMYYSAEGHPKVTICGDCR